MKPEDASAALRTERREQRSALDGKAGNGTSSRFVEAKDGKAFFERSNGSTFSLGLCRAVRRGLVKYDPFTGFYFQNE